MNNSLLQLLIANIKARIVPLVAKLKQWTSWNFIRTRLLAGIQNAFTKLLNIKPRHKKDYYEIFGWMVSRRLAMALVVITGVVSIYYLVNVRHLQNAVMGEGIKTYSCQSVMLRFASGKVRIKGKSGYLAYEGEVKDGGTNGYGVLYNPEGTVVYRGNFENSQYQGSGERYYDNGSMMYSGEFQANQFEGSGKLYRENGSLEYSGTFVMNKKEGEGKLYDDGSTAIYNGNFHQDQIVYSDLLGKKLSDIPEIYTGTRLLYDDSQEFSVVMEQINAMYQGGGESDRMDGETLVEKVSVLNGTFYTGSKECTTIDEVRDYFGAEDYEGNSEISVPEAVALNWMVRNRGLEVQTVDMTVNSDYSDYQEITGYDSSRMVYIHAFRKDGLLYSFICPDRTGGFWFYSIEKEEGGAA